MTVVTKALVVILTTDAWQKADMEFWSFRIASLHGSAFRITGPLWGESICLRWTDSLHKWPVMQSFDVSFDVSQNNWLKKRVKWPVISNAFTFLWRHYMLKGSICDECCLWCWCKVTCKDKDKAMLIFDLESPLYFYSQRGQTAWNSYRIKV